MIKAVCDICGKDLIPLDLIPLKICLSQKYKKIRQILIFKIITKGYVNDENILCDLDLCRDCRKELIKRIEFATDDVIKNMKTTANILRN